ncbi:MAG: HutD/Ves family protein [Rudaea sp.]
MPARILHSVDYQRMRWKNGGGWTTQLAVFPEPDTGTDTPFKWRVSIAEIESDGAFSTFPDCDRHIALLDGIGMQLRFDAADPVVLDRRLQFVRFAGETSTFGKLISGPVRDFNVIVRRDAYHADVMHRPLVGPMVFFADATWFVYLVSGDATVKTPGSAQSIEAGESVLLLPDADGDRMVIDGGGEVLIARFVPTETQGTAR